MSLAPLNPLPYCGLPPLPSELLTRFNLDPVLIVALLGLAALQLWRVGGRAEGRRSCIIAGWVVAAAAFISPLCALSVSLFAARVAQHMLLVLVAAPLIALGLPLRRTGRGWPVWVSAMVFFLAIWFWHMPVPYESTFTSVTSYWLMHLTMFGSAIWLWRELLYAANDHAAATLIAGALTSMQMGMLGAFLALAGHPLFRWHLLTTWSWGLTPLEDQQLGGAIMWVPGIAFFLWVAVRSLMRLWASLDGARAT
jgi:putative membrane protein